MCSRRSAWTGLKARTLICEASMEKARRDDDANARRGDDASARYRSLSFKHQTRRASRMNLGLNGRVAIVAAASTGLGKAVAFELASEGASLVISARNKDRLTASAEEIRAATGAEVLAIPGD